ncbi:MAG TPA: hypothetical protein PLI90_07715 [Rhodocyclaceae bacterium]|nr:hypothetical protein [Rhodocyclaceae bacterium]
MSKLMRIRFALLMLIAWSIAAWFAWTALIPDAKLIGQRHARSADTHADDFLQPDLDAARKILENAELWGVQRDGKPFPPPPSKEEAQKKIDWRLVGSAIRPKERYILIQVAADAPVSVKEGEALPDGGRLLKITKKVVTVLTPEGNKRQITTFAE